MYTAFMLCIGPIIAVMNSVKEGCEATRTRHTFDSATWSRAFCGPLSYVHVGNGFVIGVEGGPTEWPIRVGWHRNQDSNELASRFHYTELRIGDSVCKDARSDSICAKFGDQWICWPLDLIVEK